MAYIDPETVRQIKKVDLYQYLKTKEPWELVHFSGNTYTTKSHDSLKISNGKWMWWSRGIGGASALDYLIKVRGMGFQEACRQIAGGGIPVPEAERPVVKKEKRVLLPEPAADCEQVLRYLTGRGIDRSIVEKCIEEGLLYESKDKHNAVFLGKDRNGTCRYAAYRGTSGTRVLGDVPGSDKHFSFCLPGTEKGNIHVFEAAIDVLSYATLCRMSGIDWKKDTLLSLAGVYQPKKEISKSKVPAALDRWLQEQPREGKIYLHLDNDAAGREAAKALSLILNDHEVIDAPAPCGKDINDFLCIRKGIARKKERSWREHEDKDLSDRSAER